MKIHIVQKGDTLWELSKKYGVDFEELKHLNSQLSSPDMIMPGMKIKIPSSTKAVKQEMIPHKEVQHMGTQHPYKETYQKPMPVIHEDDHKKKMMVKPEMPMKPMPMPHMQPQPLPQMQVQPMIQTPIMEQEFQNYTTINFPQMPQYHEVKAEKPKKEHVKAQPMPVPQPMPQPQMMPHHAPMHMVPLCCHVVHPCHPPVPFPIMAHMGEGCFPSHHMMHPMHGGHMNFNQPCHQMEMPVHAMHNAGGHDCGCHSRDPFEQYAMPSFTNRSDNQEVQQQQPMFHSQQQLPPSDMYPPQFEGNQNYNYAYPNPPGYPDFSTHDERNEEEKTSE